MKSNKRNRINQDISAPEVRLIGSDGAQVGIVSLQGALQQAGDAGLDLVEISPDAKPPVCRIMDFGKFAFEQNKQKALAKKKQKKFKLKELKFRPVTEEADFQVKLRNLLSFLDEGNKVKVSLRFRGREMAHKELGESLMQRITGEVAEIGVVEHHPKLEGRQMIMVIAPKKK